MPQKKIPSYWRNLILEELARMEQERKRISDRAIRISLGRHVEEMRGNENLEIRSLADRVPSERSISRIRKEVWSQLSQVDQSQYRDFYWPESMERGDLPWEASALALEYLRELGEGGYRPSIREVRWLWRVSQAVPDAPIGIRIEAAAKLMASEEDLRGHSYLGSTVREIEWGLVRRLGSRCPGVLTPDSIKRRQRERKPLPPPIQLYHTSKRLWHFGPTY